MPDDQLITIIVIVGFIILCVAFYIFGQKASKDFREMSDELIADPTFRNEIDKAFSKTRVIICPSIAVLTIADQPNLAMLFSKTPPNRDATIAEALGAILKSNPQADLASYEEAFSIKIIKVETLKP